MPLLRNQIATTRIPARGHAVPPSSPWRSGAARGRAGRQPQSTMTFRLRFLKFETILQFHNSFNDVQLQRHDRKTQKIDRNFIIGPARAHRSRPRAPTIPGTREAPCVAGRSHKKADRQRGRVAQRHAERVHRVRAHLGRKRVPTERLAILHLFPIKFGRSLNSSIVESQQPPPEAARTRPQSSSAVCSVSITGPRVASCTSNPTPELELRNPVEI